MPNDNLLSITPIDGRYESQTKFLANYFSEFALIRTRVEVEIEWLLLISKNKSLKFIPEVSKAQQNKIIKIFKEDTLGRLLIGYGCRREEDNFYIQGLRTEERINSSGFDEEGFIIAD